MADYAAITPARRERFPMLDRLDERRVFYVVANGDRVSIVEGADALYCDELSADELRTLAAELTAIADSLPKVGVAAA